MTKKSLSHDLIMGVVIYAFLACAYTMTNSMLADTALFPRMIIALFAILNTVMVIQAFAGKHKNKFTMKDTMMPLAYFVGIIAYAALFHLTNYFVATAVMLVAFMFVLKVRPWWKIGILTAGYLVFVYVLFVVWLKANIM